MRKYGGEAVALASSRTQAARASRLPAPPAWALSKWRIVCLITTVSHQMMLVSGVTPSWTPLPTASRVARPRHRQGTAWGARPPPPPARWSTHFTIRSISAGLTNRTEGKKEQKLNRQTRAGQAGQATLILGAPLIADSISAETTTPPTLPLRLLSRGGRGYAATTTAPLETL